VAEKLGYECVAREVLIEASEHFNIPEVKLERALHDPPSVLERFTYGKQKYIAYIEEAFLEHMVRNNVVYHGLAGHFFLKGVSHALKVRIICDIEDRVRLEMEREKISEDEALHVIKKDDDERRKWGLKLYGIDTADPTLYDLVLHIHRVTVEDAVDIICHTAGLPHFQTTPESEQTMADLVLASQVRAAVVKKWPNIRVSAKEGIVTIHTEAPLEQHSKLSKMLHEYAETVPGVKEIRVHSLPT
jgi:cytidylate kinase